VEDLVKKLVLLSFVSSLVLPGIALAQPIEPAPEETYEPAPEPAPLPEPEPATEPAPAPAPAPVYDEAIEEEVADEGSWYDDLSFGIFADAYYLADWNMPQDPTSWSNAPHRAYDLSNGFNLAFGGVDLKYAGETVGATISLRYGNGAQRLIGPAAASMVGLWQAYGTWNPTDSLTLDFGQFGTIYGAEVAESWVNLNYSRGALYYLMQPFYHFGLRATYAASDMLSFKLLVVNGTNNLPGPLGFGEDGNHTPHLGGQVGITPSDALGLYVGYYTGAAVSGFGTGADLDGDMIPDPQTDDDDWEHFVDLVAVITAGDLSIVGNVDFYALPAADSIYWGASLALGYSITEQLGVAARAEILHNPDLFITGAYQRLITATGTLSYAPVDSLTLRLETRFESSDEDIYAARDEARSWGLTSTLSGAVHFGI
jgi:hypothetical protein